MQRLQSNRRGFTLMEMMVVVGVVGIVAAIAVPGIFRMGQRSALRASANGMVSAFKLARTSAASGRSSVPGWPADARTIEAGVRLVNDTQFVVFVDQDRAAGSGNEAIIRTYDLTDDYPSFRITSPAALPVEIRFQRNGMLTQPPDVDVIMQDLDSGQQYTIRAAYGGRVEIRD